MLLTLTSSRRDTYGPSTSALFRPPPSSVSANVSTQINDTALVHNAVWVAYPFTLMAPFSLSYILFGLFPVWGRYYEFSLSMFIQKHDSPTTKIPPHSSSILEYCITLYFRGRKFSRKVNLKYFREKIFSRVYCSRENIFPRKYLPAKISSRENIFLRFFFRAANM